MTEFIKEQLDIESHRYSRQSYAIGQDAQVRLTEAKILIMGYNSLAQEIIRNLALTGVREIGIYVNQTGWNNTCCKTNMYYSMENEIPLVELSKLNPFTQIKSEDILDEDRELDIKQIKKYNLIILTNSAIDDAIAINRITHKLSIPFIMCGTYGLTGYVFNDFGENFHVSDIDGEQSNPLILDTIDEKMLKFKDAHGLSNDDTINITWSDNNTTNYKIYRKRSPILVELVEMPEQDKKKYSKILRNKISKNFNFEQIKENLEPDNFTPVVADWSVPLTRSNFLHELHMGLNKYFSELNCLPRSWSIVDWEVFQKYFDFKTEEDKILAQKFCYTLQGDLIPIASIIGGIASHEALKAITHKFIPIVQWYYMDYLDLIMNEEITNYDDITRNNYKTKSKYDGIVNVFGKQFMENFQSKVPFIIGSGAIGCELVKNLGMMGVKQIYLTDPDHIEKSNLSRQFLFNDEDIRQSKSEVASKKIKRMNPDTNVCALKYKMCAETENIFNDEFHSGIYTYLNALDNVEARNYVDSMAIRYSKPLIDSGTLGSKGNVQVVLPYLTESYSSTKDPEEKTGIPICTIKSFPYKPEHTIQWARELFETEFNQIPNLIAKYSNYDELLKINDSDSKILLKQLYKYDGFTLNVRGYLKILLTIFTENYYVGIKEILDKYSSPESKEELGDKKLPVYLDFTNIFREQFMNWIANGFILLNQVFKTNISINLVELEQELANIIGSNLSDSEFYANLMLNFGFKYNLDELNSNNIINIVHPIILQMPQTSLIDFEKDDDELGHVSWICLSSNMRNSQYSIPQMTLYETRKIAGGIIPAMITTTSVISGFQILEYLRICKLYWENKYFETKQDEEKDHMKDIEKYKNRYVNLNINYCDGINPTSATLYKLDEKQSISSWTKYELETFDTDKIIEQIQSITNKKIEFITSGNKTIYDGDDISVETLSEKDTNILVLLEDIEMGIPVYIMHNH